MYKTYVDVTCIKFPCSSDGHDVFPLASLQYSNISESMIQGDRKMTVEQWRGMLGKLDDIDHLEEGLCKTFFLVTSVIR